MERSKNKKSTFLYFLVTVVILGLTFFFLEQTIITDVTPGYYFDPLTLSNQMMVAGIIVTLVSIFSGFVVRRIRLSINGIFLCIILGAVFLASLINIIMIPRVQELSVRFMDGTFNTIRLELPNRMRLTAIMALVVNFSFIFFVVLVLPNHHSFLKLVFFFVASIIILTFIAIGYSIVTEWDKYLTIMKEGYENSTQVPASFFNNRNPYASFLLSSQIMLFFIYYLNVKKKRRYFYILLQIPLVFAINFTFSKTNLLLANFLVLLVFLHHLIMLLVKGKVFRFGLELFIALILIVGLIVFRFSPALIDTKIALYLRRTIPDALFDLAPRSFEARKELWYYAITLIVSNPITFIFGDGPHISRYFYHLRIEQEISGAISMGFGDYHNGTIEVMHTFGVSGVIIYGLIILFVIIMLLRRSKTDRSLTFFTILSLAVFLFRSQMESLAILLFKSEGIMASLTFVMPCLYLLRKSHDAGFGKEIQMKKD
ncbi:MAG: hypothetical protein BWY30_00205 [Tenericutes bacterium ADurb.Bin239]|nr:MAG: hypothetical protein BWY30_00205 [Tenericutes bacterium ADurb.Bin239]